MDKGNAAALMKQIQIYDFALQEAKLFLDTHPDNRSALEFYKKHLELSKQAREVYVTAYGPIVAENYDGGSWKWIDSPWPWELNEEG